MIRLLAGGTVAMALLLSVFVVGSDSAARPRDEVVVSGVLTNEGVECQALRGDDGSLYTLTGRLKNFGPGDRVRVRGEIAEFSFCQQGTTIVVRQIQKAK